MAADVFISYARDVSGENVAAVRSALGGRASVFLDVDAIRPGDAFPPALLDALFVAKVIVAFIHPAYLARAWCWWELRAALGPYDWPSTDVSARGDDRARSAGLVLAIPVDKKLAGDALQSTPLGLQDKNWPLAPDADAIATLVSSELGRPDLASLAARIDRARGAGAAQRLREELEAEGRLPPPQWLGDIPCVPKPLPRSLSYRFRGRAGELERLSQLLWSRGDTEKPAVAITSIGGSGKTTLAREFVHRYGPNQFPGGLFWIDAEANALEQQFSILTELDRRRGAELATRFGGTMPDWKAYREANGDDAPRRLAADVYAAFGRLPPAEPAIVVVDNVPEANADGSEVSLDALCPMRGQAAVLLTSRLRYGDEADGVIPFEIGQLDAAAGVRVLTQSLSDPTQLDRDEWEQIVEWVGGLPLALRMLNGAMVKRAYTPAELLERANASASQTEALEAARSVLLRHEDTRLRHGVLEALKLSFDGLPSAAQRMAKALALLSAAPIPMNLLEHFERELYAPNEIVAARAARAELVGHSFIEDSPGGTGATIAGVPMFGAMHRVLADVLRSQLTDDERDRFLWSAARAAAQIITMQTAGEAHRWPTLNACMPHTIEVLLACFKQDANGDEIRTAVALSAASASYIIENGVRSDAVALADKTSDAVGAWCGTDNRLWLLSMQNLAHTLEEAGEPIAAHDMRAEILPDCERILGPDDSTTLMAKRDLAHGLAMSGQTREAKELLVDLLPRAIKEFGPTSRHVTNAKGELAHVLSQLGEQEHAMTLWREVAGEEEARNGPTHPDSIASKFNLGLALFEHGEQREAWDMLRELLATTAAAFGSENAHTLRIRGSMAQIVDSVGNPDGRREQREVVEGLMAQLGPMHPDVIRAIDVYASMLIRAGEKAEGGRLLAEVLRARETKLGADHPATIATREELAALWREEGAENPTLPS